MYKIIETEFKGGLKGHALFFDVKKIREEYRYLGLWYARDGSEKTLITTELYYTDGPDTKIPPEFSEEVKENSFKQVKRLSLPLKHDRIWAATRVDGDNYCMLKADPLKSGHVYLNYKTIRNRGAGFDLLDKGIFKGGSADFFRLGIEDLKGAEDYTDAILYVVMSRDIPPDDWNLDHLALGIQNVPVMVPTCTFTTDRKYTDWNGQNPLAQAQLKG